MQRFFALIGKVVVIGLAVGIGKLAVSAWWPSSITRNSQAEAAVSDTQAVSSREAIVRGIIWIRATLPRNVNDQTRLVAVGLDGSTYWSRLVLDVNAGEMSANAKADVRRDTIEDACKRLRWALNRNEIATYRADYVDRSRNPVQTVSVMKNDCQ